MNVLKNNLGWLKNIGMVVNPEKTEFVNFSKTGEDYISLTIAAQRLASSNLMNVRGVTFDKAPFLGSHTTNNVKAVLSLCFDAVCKCCG